MICRKFKSKEELNLKVGCRIFPHISDRVFWEKAKATKLEAFEQKRAELEKEPRRFLTATLYREFAVNGNRSNYEDIYFKRRTELIVYVILECMYNDGRFMEEILDLTWMILEETTWTLPAHNREVDVADSLSDFVDHSLDLFLAETACTMAFVYQVLGDKLDEMSKVVTRRIKARLEHDVISDYLNRNDYWWMGFGEEIPNNWNPWINSNVLAVALIIEDDKERLRDVVYKVMTTLDNYFDQYPFDGACDEGPNYWGQAGLSMLECLWLLDMVTDGQLNFFKEQKVINTLEYFMKVYIGNGESVNFADSPSKVSIYCESLYKFAKLTDNKMMLAFARTVHGLRDIIASVKTIRIIDMLTYSDEIVNMQPIEFTPELDYYFESTEVMISKADMDTSKGLYLAAKGGHNAESHNHNDIGNFIVYKNGVKFIVDSGNMVYSKITFSPQRYTLWTNRSTYHNLPVIDGKEQYAGREYASKNAKYEKTDKKVTFSLDIKDAYSNRDEIEKWVRTIEYDKAAQEISVTEDFAFRNEFEYELNFLTPQNAEKNGKSVIFKADNGETLEMVFERDMFELSEEKIKIEDRLLLNNWGDTLYRVTLKSKAKEDILKYIIK